MRTYSPKIEEIERTWHVVDAEGLVLGRLATEVALRLRGKHKPQYTPHTACGDFVVITNASKVRLTGNKLKQKKRYSHSGYPGHLKEESYEHFLARVPERVVLKAVKGMLPHGVLGRKLATRCKVYAGPEHPHAAQQPKQMVV